MRNTDIILIVPLIWGVYRGFFRGLISEVISLVALAIVFYVSVRFYSAFGVFLSSLFHPKISAGYMSIIGFIVLFVVLYIVVYLLSMKIESTTHALHVSLVNHLLGGVFGLIKWAFIISIVLALLTNFGKESDFRVMRFNHSWLYNHIQPLAPEVMPDFFSKSV